MCCRRIGLLILTWKAAQRSHQVIPVRVRAPSAGHSSELSSSTFHGAFSLENSNCFWVLNGSRIKSSRVDFVPIKYLQPLVRSYLNSGYITANFRKFILDNTRADISVAARKQYVYYSRCSVYSMARNVSAATCMRYLREHVIPRKSSDSDFKTRMTSRGHQPGSCEDNARILAGH